MQKSPTSAYIGQNAKLGDRISGRPPVLWIYNFDVTVTTYSIYTSYAFLKDSNDISDVETVMK